MRQASCRSTNIDPMPHLVHQPVTPLLYGYHIETGIDAAAELSAVGSTGDHWCLFMNNNESPRKVKVTGTVKKSCGVRYHRHTKDGQGEEHRRWSESATLPALPGARWLKKPERERVECHHGLKVIHLADSPASLVVKFKARRTDHGAWEDAGEAVLQVRIGNGCATHG